MIAENIDVPALRNHVKRLENYLRTDPHMEDVCRAARSIASNALSSDLQHQARNLPAHRFSIRNGVRYQLARDAGFDAQIEQFIASCYSTFDEIEAIQQQMRDNASLSVSECRRRVLELAEHDNSDYLWSGDVSVRIGLSQRQVIDAIEHYASVLKRK